MRSVACSSAVSVFRVALFSPGRVPSVARAATVCSPTVPFELSSAATERSMQLWPSEDSHRHSLPDRSEADESEPPSIGHRSHVASSLLLCVQLHPPSILVPSHVRRCCCLLRLSAIRSSPCRLRSSRVADDQTRRIHRHAHARRSRCTLTACHSSCTRST